MQIFEEANYMYDGLLWLKVHSGVLKLNTG